MKKLSILVMAAGLSVLSVHANADDKQAAVDQARTEAAESVKNQTTGQEFLSANKNKPGVKTLQDGLQYKVLTMGAGEKPTANDVVEVDYAGTLIDGTEFDSSYKRGQPATFPISGVIPGWTEALQLMPVGSTWMLYIPANLAYGEQGAPPSIGPNETLIFKVHLISIQKQ